MNALHKASVEQAGFAVLKAPDIPSILVETAFISNPDEEKRLKDAAYQDKMANAILGGIKRYLAQNPPLARTRLAASRTESGQNIFRGPLRHVATVSVDPESGAEAGGRNRCRRGGLRPQHRGGLERRDRAREEIALEGIAVVGAQEVQLLRASPRPRR